MTVSFQDSITRSFSYKVNTWTTEMIVRDNRWLGDLGVYTGDGSFDSQSPINRLVYAECLKNFDSIDSAMDWLKEEWNHNKIKYVWTSDGLVGGLRETPARHQLNVDLFKITIQGRPVTNFPTAESNSGSLRLIK